MTIPRVKLPAVAGWWPTPSDIRRAYEIDLRAWQQRQRAVTRHVWAWHLQPTGDGYALRRAALEALPRFRPHCP